MLKNGDIKYCFLNDIDNVIPIVQTVYKWQEEQWGSEGVIIFAGAIKTVVAIKDKKVIGCAALVRCDLKTYQFYFPWLAGVYVTPEERNSGVATNLIWKIVEAAKDLGYKDLYLYSKLVSFYENKGWECVSQIPNTTEFVMHKEL